MKKYRVIQWATGMIGKESIKMIVKHPALELAGVRVYSPDKVGVDAGTICGISPTGVFGTDSEEDLLALDADCILWEGEVPRSLEEGVAELCRLLASGKNVISIVHVPYLHPASLPPELRDPVEAACAKGNSSLHLAGIHPGFAAEVIGSTMTGTCRRIDQIRVREIMHFDFFETPYIPVELIGFGKDRATIEAFLNKGHYRPTVRYLGQALGVEVKKIDMDWEIHMAERDWETGFGVIRKGTVAAMRYHYTGYVDGQPRIIVEFVRRTHPDQVPDWPKGATYKVSIEGDPSWEVDLNIPFKKTMDTTGFIAVHSIPAVCEAAPGIVTRLDLPIVTGLGVLGG